jgi:hypothetical protein
VSDDLDIRGGGAVAVDTATLRAAARGFAVAAGELEDAAAIVDAAARRLTDVGELGWEVSFTVAATRRRLAIAIEGAAGIADDLRAAASMYEIVELRAERAAAEALGDEGAVARADRRMAALVRDHPFAETVAALGAARHVWTWPNGLTAQAPGLVGWLMPGTLLMAAPLAWSLQQAIGGLGAGTIPSTARLSGPAHDVVVTRLTTGAAGGAATSGAGGASVGGVPLRGVATAPSSLADAASRVPGDGEARVRVERYAMPDGTRQFAVYIAGTRTVEAGTAEPFDMTSNIELYTGERSASFDATLAALADAGARPGDTVHTFGHSQGAMVAARVALEGGYDVPTVVSFGSPVEADLGDGTLSVALRHEDDPVSALAGGGHAHAVGGPGSFVASRTADPLPGPHDLRMPAHGIDAYTQTASLLDASDDPRMGAVRDVFDGLRGAASVEVIEYSAARVLIPTEDRPPQPGSGSGCAPVSPSSSGGG